MNTRTIPKKRQLNTVIIGAGFGGLAQAYYLLKAGISDFSIFERADEVGGTWRDNHYPGCACDVPSDLYSLSFAPNPDWELTFGKQEEIYAYLRKVADDHGLRPRIRFEHDIERADWDEASSRWILQTNHGVYSCKILISATGPYGKAKYPGVPGREDFQGDSFHSLHWDHDCDLRGKRAGVIGTGASALQIVPAIAPEVAELVQFQRTPTWIVPRIDWRRSALSRKIRQRLPLTQSLSRTFQYGGFEAFVGLPQFSHPIFLESLEAIGRWHLKRQIPDPKLREALTPDYRFSCKRPILSSNYYPALMRDNVHLETTGIERITATGVKLENGEDIPLDIIVYATGYEVLRTGASLIFAADGRSLLEHFGDRVENYLGTVTHGFPNLFTLLGPFSAPGTQSCVFMLEVQARYVTQAIQHMQKKQLAQIEISENAAHEFSEEMHRLSERTTWVNGGCNSFYQSASGHNAGLWPNWTFVYRWRARKFRPAVYAQIPEGQAA